MLELERSDNPALDVEMIPFNFVPLSESAEGITGFDAERMLEDKEIDDYKYIRLKAG